MTCDQFLKALDEDLPVEDPSFTAHEVECADCRAAKACWEEVRKEFSTMGREPAPPFLHTRIMAHVKAAGREDSAPGFLGMVFLRNRWAASIAALFIGALLGGAGVWQVLRSGSSSSGQLPSPAPRSLEKLGMDDAKSQLVEPPEPRQAQDGAAAAAKPTTAAPAPKPPAPAGELFERGGAAPSPASASPEEEETPELSAGEIRLKGSGDQGAPGPSRAPAQPTNEPVGQERDILSTAPRTEAAPTEADSAVVCMIRPEGGGATKVIQIGAESAPPAGSPWTMVVQRGGAFYLLDFAGKPVKPEMGLVNELAGLDLPPGRYVLRRVG